MVGVGLVAAGIDALLGFDNEVAFFVKIEEVGGEPLPSYQGLALRVYLASWVLPLRRYFTVT